MPKSTLIVIPIRRDIVASDDARAVADLAYDLWLANGFAGGSPEEILLTAMRQLRVKTVRGLFLVSKRKTCGHNPYPLAKVFLN